MLEIEVLRFLKEHRSGTHAMLFYESPEKKREVLFSYLNYGINTKGLVYVCSEESPQEIEEEMKSFEIDTEYLKRKNRLSIRNYDEVYIVDGQVDIPQIISKFSTLANGYASSGLRGLRATAEMSCFFHKGKTEELLMYESAVHRKFSFKAEGICAFNIFEAMSSGFFEMAMPLLRAHDTVIFAGPEGQFVVDPSKVKADQMKRLMEVTASA